MKTTGWRPFNALRRLGVKSPESELQDLRASTGVTLTTDGSAVFPRLRAPTAYSGTPLPAIAGQYAGIMIKPLGGFGLNVRRLNVGGIGTSGQCWWGIRPDPGVGSTINYLQSWPNGLPLEVYSHEGGGWVHNYIQANRGYRLNTETTFVYLFQCNTGQNQSFTNIGLVPPGWIFHVGTNVANAALMISCQYELTQDPEPLERDYTALAAGP